MLTEIHGWFPRPLAPIYEQGVHRGVTKEQLRATNSFVKYKSPTCPSSQFVEHKLTVWGKREFPCKFKAIHERLLTRGISTCKKSIVLPDLHCTLISLGLSGSQQKEDPLLPFSTEWNGDRKNPSSHTGEELSNNCSPSFWSSCSGFFRSTQKHFARRTCAA